MTEKKRGLRNTRMWKRFAAICMAVVMAVTMLPIIPGAKDVYAAQVEGDTIHVTINFFNFTQTAPITPSIANPGDSHSLMNYHVVATLTDKTTKEVAGYGFQILDNINQASQTIDIRNFYTTAEGARHPNVGPWPGTVQTAWTDLDGGYDPAKYDVKLRLLYGVTPATYNGGWYNFQGASYSELMNQNSTVDGYLFSGSSIEGYDGEINLFKGHNTYEVEFIFDPEPGTITDQDNFYLVATAKHQSTEDSYYVTKLTSNGASEKLVLKVENPDWTNDKGESQNEKYSTSWNVDVRICQAEEGAEPSQSQIINGNLIVNKDVKVLNGYTVTVDPTLQKQEDPATETEYVKQVINLSKVKTSKDYTMFDILGDSLYYGLTAPEIIQSHHSETNLATKVYSNPGNGNWMEPDLSGIGDTQVPGTFLIGEIKKGEQLQFGNLTPKTPVVLVGKGCESQVFSSKPDVAVAVGTDKDSINAKVDSMIDHMLDVSADLAAQTPTDISINIVESELRIDTTSLPDGATIYVDGDKYSSYIAKGEVLKIKKNPKQLIVFNFKTTKDVVIGKAYVDNGDGMKSTETVNQAYSDPKNIAADQVAQGLVWNVANMDPGATFKQDKAGGMFLLPNPKVKADIGNASCGWVISAAPFEIKNGEFHFVYRDLKPEGVSSVLLQAFKTVDGVNATEDQKFEFSLSRFDGTDFVPVEIPVLDVDGQPTGTTIPYKVINNKNRINFAASNMLEGINVFLIKETKKAEDTDGAYKIDSSKDIYAAFTVIVQDLNGTKVKIPGAVKYYGSFDPTTGELTDELDADGRTFKNTTITDVAKLTLTKSFGGAVVESDLETLSFEIQKKDGTVVATFALKDTDVFEKKAEGRYEMKEAYELEVGEYNIIETNYDASGAKVSVSYSIGAGSTDYKTDGTAAGGNYSVAQTFAKDDDIVLNFKNEYPSTDVKISKTNLGGQEIDGASLTLTGTVGTGTTPVIFTTEQVTPGTGVTGLEVSADGKTLSWISGTSATTIGNLPNGKYTLHEVSAPLGFAIANDFKFVVKDKKVYKEDGTTLIDDNKVVLVDDGSTTVEISKVIAATTTELAGATLELTGRKADGSGAITFDLDKVKLGTGAKDKALSESDTKVSWVSGTGATTVEELPNGIYSLTEKTAPQGFAQNNEVISFILEDGKVYKNNGGVKGDEITTKKLTMENAYTPINVTLEATKTLKNSAGTGTVALQGEEFVFTLTDPLGTYAAQTKKNDADGKVTFDPISISSTGDFEFTIAETAGNDAMITYDDTQYKAVVSVTGDTTGLHATVTYKVGNEVKTAAAFENQQKPKGPAKVNLTASKTFKDETGATIALTGDEFEFTLTNVNDATDKQTKKNAAGGTVTFDELTFAETGTYKYTIKETPGNNAMIDYDTSEYTATIVVTEGATALQADVTYKKGNDTATAVTFENKKLAKKPAKVNLTASKTFKDETGAAIALTGDEFEFTLTNQDDANDKQTKKNAAGGTVTFDELTFTAAGTYKYTIKETPGNDALVDYDASEYTVTIEVEEVTGELKANVTYKKGNDAVTKVAFENKKKAKTPATVNLSAAKTYNDETGTPIALTGDEFEFTLTNKNDATDKQTKKNAAGGTVTFDELSFTAAGTYEYIIKETPGNNKDISYDTSEYTATIVVTEGTTAFSADVTLKKGTTKVNAVEFTNTKLPDVGSLKILKSISGEGASKDSIKVTVKKGNQYVTDQGALVDTETKITVPTGTTGVTISNLPIGDYTVEEVLDSAVIAKYTLITTGAGASTTSMTKTVEKDKTAEVQLVNKYERDKGTLKVTKTVSPNAPKTSFSITIKESEGTNPKFVNANGELVTTDPGLTVTAGTTLTIANVPTGSYTVTEDVTGAEVNGYTLVADGTATKTVTKNGEVTAALTNTYTRDTGSLQITKAFSGATPPSNLLNLTFEVSGPADFQTVTLVYPTDFTNGIATLNNIPTGSYTVTESGAGDVVDGATVYTFDTTTIKTASVDVVKGATKTATITNKYSSNVVKGSLTLSKQVTVNGGAPADIVNKAGTKSYKVTIKNAAGEYVNAAGELVANDPGLTITAGTDLVINNIPLGAYTVSEVTSDLNNIDPTLTYDTQSSTPGVNVSFTLTDYTVAKTLVNVFTYEEPQPDEYPVLITKADAVTGEEIPGAVIKLFKNGTLIRTWTSKTVAETFQLEEGTYTFREETEPLGYEKVTTEVEFKVEKDTTVAAGYKVTVTTISGDVEQRADGTIVLLDAPKKGSLKITKKVTSDTANKPAKDTFKVYVYNTDKQVYVTDAQGTTSAVQTSIEVPVTGLTINNLPLGRYTVEEDVNDAENVEGFAFDHDRSTFAANTEIKVNASNTVINGKADLTNIYMEKRGDLKITKTVEGDKPKKDSFKVTVKNAAGKYIKADGTVSDTQVVLDVSVKNGLTIKNLLPGKYTVAEIGKDMKVSGYTRTGGTSSTQVTVIKEQTVEAKLVNRYKEDETGKLSVHVTEEKSGKDVKEATVEVTYPDGTTKTFITNEKGEIVDENGEVPTVPVGDYLITVTDVPEGYDVKTGETGEVTVEKNKEAHHDAVISTDRGGIIITVYDEETGDVVPDAVLEIEQPDGTVKTYVTDKNGQVTEFAKKDEYGNYTAEPGEYRYTVIEVPEGYRVTTGEEQTGTVVEKELTELEAKIAPKTGGLDIKVIDEKTKKPVEGATVEVTYPDGSVHTFITDKDGMITELSKKKDGHYTARTGEYQIKIVKVPDGYSVKVGETTTQIIEEGKLKHHVAEIATATEDTVQTGDSTPVAWLFVLLIASAAGFAFVLYRKRRTAR